MHLHAEGAEGMIQSAVNLTHAVDEDWSCCYIRGQLPAAARLCHFPTLGMAVVVKLPFCLLSLRQSVPKISLDVRSRLARPVCADYPVVICLGRNVQLPFSRAQNLASCVWFSLVTGAA